MQSISAYLALQEHTSRQPGADAIVIGDVTITYAEFLERITVFAGWLLHNGLVPGEATGICLRDEVWHLVSAMALMCLGTPQIGLGSHENGATKRALARRVGVTQLIVERAEDWMEPLRLFVAPLGNPNAVRTAPIIRPSDVFPARPLSAIGIYQNTSGSTNTPKTFGLSLERLLITSQRYYAREPKERRSLRTGSIEFDAHRLYRIYSLIAGNTCIFLRRVNLGRIIDLCERHEVTAFRMGAYQLISLVGAEAHYRRRLPSFTSAHLGGTRIAGHLRGELKRLLTDNLWVLYATGEVGMISCASPDQHNEFPEGVGFPASNVVVEIVDSNGKHVAPGEIGHIRVRKPGLPKCYIADGETSSNFDDGWFYPQDLVSLKEGEPLIFHGRADDVIILSNINVFPSAIEDLLEDHPDVKEAVAFPIYSRIHGEVPVAAVVLQESAPKDVSHLLDQCRKALGIRAPRQIYVVDRIPRNAAGKPLRRELAASH